MQTENRPEEFFCLLSLEAFMLNHSQFHWFGLPLVWSINPVVALGRMSVFSLYTRRWTLIVATFFCTQVSFYACGAENTSPGLSRYAPGVQAQIPKNPAEVVARVGPSVVLAGQIQVEVDAYIARVTKQKGPIPSGQVQEAQTQIFREYLRHWIRETRVAEAFIYQMLGSQPADKRAEARKTMETRVRSEFYEKRLPIFTKKLKADSVKDVDAELRKNGTSLKAFEKKYIRDTFMQGYQHRIARMRPEIPIREVEQYYREHLSDYEYPAKARWEQLTVLFENFSTRAEAEKAIAEMGNEARFGGNVQAVARARSQEPFASSGGVHDWTSQGSLASEALDASIFQLPLNQLSKIISDENGLHIVRVLERKPAGRTSVSEVQDAIVETLREQKKEQARKEADEYVYKNIPVWSLFPEDVEGGAKPLLRR